MQAITIVLIVTMVIAMVLMVIEVIMVIVVITMVIVVITMATTPNSYSQSKTLRYEGSQAMSYGYDGYTVY